jgi:hypothetical protein
VSRPASKRAYQDLVTLDDHGASSEEHEESQTDQDSRDKQDEGADEPIPSSSRTREAQETKTEQAKHDRAQHQAGLVPTS